MDHIPICNNRINIVIIVCRQRWSKKILPNGLVWPGLCTAPKNMNYYFRSTLYLRTQAYLGEFEIRTQAYSGELEGWSSRNSRVHLNFVTIILFYEYTL